MKEYEDARRRIFNEEIICDIESKSRNFKKIQRLREKAAIKKRMKNKIESSILAINDDNRPYAKVIIEGEEILGLLDSGASLSCLGRGALEFIKKHNIDMIKMTEDIRTADGKQQQIHGRFKSTVSWSGKTQEIELYVVPSLQQQLYLGVDFWRTFKVAPNIVSSLDISSSTVEPVFDPMRTLSPAQSEELERVKLTFPSCAVLGLGKTTVEEHVIEMEDESIPIKQRHYPISPVVQKLMYAELDRMLELGVIETSNSAYSSPVVLVRKPGKNRLCLDSRKINTATKKFCHTLKES